MRFEKLVFVLLSMTYWLKAQQPASTLVNDYLKAVHAKQSSADLIQKILSANASDVFYAIIPYISDSSAEVRYEAYNLMDIVGKKTVGENTRKKIVNAMLKGCTDPDAGICSMLLNSLNNYKKKDFDGEAKYQLISLSKEKICNPEELIMISGFVGVEDLKIEYRKWLNEKNYPNNKVRWALYLALSRMGDTSAINYCLRRVRSLPVGDDLVYDVLPDLVYTCQKAAYDYLFEIIESDEKRCSSPNPDSNAKILCAFRVAEQIAPYIEGFPVDIDASGGLKAKDYSAALAQIRSWIRSNRGNYRIKTDLY